jgi:tRNA threonylcarbamoyladenosine biosynthesis protein TsaB
MKSTTESPLILSIESSGATCGVVLAEGANFLAEYSLFGNNLHDKLLAELCRRVLDDCGKSFDQLDAVAVSAGPGSFTGVRIGVSVTKGICFGGGIRCIAIPTLAAFAGAATEYAASLGIDEIIVVLPSNQQKIFMQRFNAQAIANNDIEICEYDKIQSLLSEKTIICGTAASAFRTKAHQLSGLNRLTPRFIARLAAQYYAQQQWIDPEILIPLYAQEFIVKSTGKNEL